MLPFLRRIVIIAVVLFGHILSFSPLNSDSAVIEFKIIAGTYTLDSAYKTITISREKGSLYSDYIDAARKYR